MALTLIGAGASRPVALLQILIGATERALVTFRPLALLACIVTFLTGSIRRRPEEARRAAKHRTLAIREKEGPLRALRGLVQVRTFTFIRATKCIVTLHLTTV